VCNGPPSSRSTRSGNRCGRTVEEFRFNRWRDGALLGAKPERAFFVRCDRTTMTHDDIDNGRTDLLVGRRARAREGACGSGSAF
jgi:phage tail sheath protein FI